MYTYRCTVIVTCAISLISIQLFRSVITCQTLGIIYRIHACMYAYTCTCMHDCTCMYIVARGK